MQGDVAKRVENIDSEDSCAIYVRDNYPDAAGATWYLNSSCWAEYGKYDFRSSLHRTCHFTGWISLGNLLVIYIMVIYGLINSKVDENNIIWALFFHSRGELL